MAFTATRLETVLKVQETLCPWCLRWVTIGGGAGKVSERTRALHLRGLDVYSGVCAGSREAVGEGVVRGVKRVRG